MHFGVHTDEDGGVFLTSTGVIFKRRGEVAWGDWQCRLVASAVAL